MLAIAGVRFRFQAITAAINAACAERGYEQVGDRRRTERYIANDSRPGDDGIDDDGRIRKRHAGCRLGREVKRQKANLVWSFAIEGNFRLLSSA
jgi:hypothetical protein